jgi:hypothetical protein
MMKRLKISLVEEALNDGSNWIRSARLVKKAANGNEKAAKEIVKLENTPLVKIPS